MRLKFFINACNNRTFMRFFVKGKKNHSDADFCFIYNKKNESYSYYNCSKQNCVKKRQIKLSFSFVF
jgi:hypothetical protein